MKAKAKLCEFDGTAFTDDDLFIVEFERLFSICTSWLKRLAEDDFDKSQRTLLQALKWYKMRTLTMPLTKGTPSMSLICRGLNFVWSYRLSGSPFLINCYCMKLSVSRTDPHLFRLRLLILLELEDQLQCRLQNKLSVP